MKNRTAALLFPLLCLVPAASRAFPGVGSRGVDFWLGLPGVYDAAGVSWLLSITAASNVSGQAAVPGLGFTAPFSVPAGGAATVSLPLQAMDTLSDAVTQLGVHVTATGEVSIECLEAQDRASESFLALPTDALGTDYLVLAFPSESLPVNGSNISQSAFVVAGTQGGTAVTITPSVAAGGRAAGVPYRINLGPGDVYQLRSANPGDDLSGTALSSNFPIGVWGANACADVPDGRSYCNPLLEQLWPLSDWGTTFVSFPLAGRLNGDTFRILASADATAVSVNGVSAALLNRGQVAQTVLSAPSLITANHPLYVGQLADSSAFDYPTPSPTPAPGDPMMASLPPVQLWDNEYVFRTFPGFPASYAELLAPSGLAGSVSLDGAPIPASAFSPAGGGYSGAAVPLTDSVHRLSAPGAFGALVYGFSTADAYGHPAGILMATATPTPTPCGYPGNTCTPTFTPTPTASPTPSPSPTATPPIRIWPNPFNPFFAAGGTVKVSFLPPGSTVSFFTLSGELVRRVPESMGTAFWDGRNRDGVPAAPGVYFYVVQEGGRVLLRGKLILMRSGP